MEQGSFTLSDLFANLDGQYYGGGRAMEEAVIEAIITNSHELPAHFSYKDAVVGAWENGWFKVHPDGTPGVRIDLAQETEPSK